MPRRTISGFSNPTVKYLRSLRDKKHRRREGKFLAEGLRLLTDARENGRLPETLVMADVRDEHPLLAALIAEVESGGGEIVETSGKRCPLDWAPGASETTSEPRVPPE